MYSSLMRPAVRAMVTENERRTGSDAVIPTAFASKCSPTRTRSCGQLQHWAETVRRDRRPVSPENPFLAFEHMAIAT